MISNNQTKKINNNRKINNRIRAKIVKMINL